MTATIKTKSGWITIETRKPLHDHEKERMAGLTIEQLWHIPSLRGIRLED